MLIEKFTEEQFKILDLTTYNPRCLIQGGAGTGKTIMAKEIFRRSLNRNQKIGFFCFNSLLGHKLHEDLSGIFSESCEGTYVGHLHSYLMKNTSIQPPRDDPGVFYSTELPIEFLITIDDDAGFKKFDLLIIDEAQDLSTQNYLEVFDSILEGGLSGGQWLFFGDFSNQSIFVSNQEDGIENLNSMSIFTRLPPLEVNCRNTKKIALYNSVVTGCGKQLSPESMPEGEKVEQFFLPENEIPEKVEKVIRNIGGSIPTLKNVTILSKSLLDNGILKNSDYIRKKINNTHLEYHTISAYKGLENSIIILTDIDDFESEQIINLLYVGISRARLKLYLICDSEYEQDYKALVSENLRKS